MSRALPNSGRHGITRRERDVLQALASGLCRDEIAERHGVKNGTVSTQLQSLYIQFNVHHQVALLVAAVKAGLVTIERDS